MKKVINWFKTAGLRSFAYLAAGVGAVVLLGSWFLAGIGLGIFLADNFVTIRDLIKEEISK